MQRISIHVIDLGKAAWQTTFLLQRPHYMRSFRLLARTFHASKITPDNSPGVSIDCVHAVFKAYTLHTHICFWHSCLIDKRKQHQPLAWLGHLIKSPWNMALRCSEIVLRRSNLEKWKIKKKGENTVTVHVGYLSLVDEQVNLDCSLPKA